MICHSIVVLSKYKCTVFFPFLVSGTILSFLFDLSHYLKENEYKRQRHQGKMLSLKSYHKSVLHSEKIRHRVMGCNGLLRLKDAGTSLEWRYTYKDFTSLCRMKDPARNSQQ